MKLFSLEGKTALITGATKGIGRGIALRMAEAGAQIVVSSRKKERCDEVVAEIQAAGGTAIAVPCDTSNIDSVNMLADKALETFGRVDVLVGNAAANPHFGPLVEIDSASIDKIIATNMKANLQLAKRLLPGMAANRDGAVIFVTSVAGLRGSNDIGAYGMSKAALSSMARSLAVGWGEFNVRVNCIAPGVIKTDFAKPLHEDPETLRKTEALYPLRRLGEVDDVAGVAVFLASRAGAFITGQELVVDGGAVIATARPSE